MKRTADPVMYQVGVHQRERKECLMDSATPWWPGYGVQIDRRRIREPQPGERLSWTCPGCGRRTVEHTFGEDRYDRDQRVEEIASDPYCAFCKWVEPGGKVRDRYGYTGVVVERRGGWRVKVAWDRGRVVRRRSSVEDLRELRRGSGPGQPGLGLGRRL